MLRKLLFGLLGILLLFAALVGTLIYLNIPIFSVQGMSVIPNDALYVFRTEKPLSAWTELRQHPAWEHLRQQPYFGKLTESANEISNTLQGKEELLTALADREVLISAHPVSPKNYDFLFTVDIGRVGQFSELVQRYVRPFLLKLDYDAVEKKYKNFNTFELSAPGSETVLHLAFMENLLLLSWDKALLQRSLDHRRKPNFAKEERFVAVEGQTASGGLGQLFLPMERLDDFMAYYDDEENPYVKGMSKALYFSGFELSVEQAGNFGTQDLLTIQGPTRVRDSVRSVFHALLLSGQGDLSAHKVIPQQLSFYASFTFTDFFEFYNNALGLLQDDELAYENYEKRKLQVENYLKIDLEDDFFNWMGDEIAFAQLPPEQFQKPEDGFALFLQARDASEARRSLKHITEQIRKKTPVKFKSYKHRGQSINFMHVKGFFKLFMGKYFEKIEKPYFTIIEDFVVFSNSAEALEHIIDDYVLGTTLLRDRHYKAFWDNFSSSSSFFGYAYTPLGMKRLKEFLDEETWETILLNESYVKCFPQMGFQLRADDDHTFDTRIIAEFMPPEKVAKLQTEKKVARQKMLRENQNSTTLTEVMDFFSKEDRAKNERSRATSADLLSTENLPEPVGVRDQTTVQGDSLEVARTVEGKREGSYKLFVSGRLRVKGRYRDGKKHGIWRYYDEEGREEDKERYKSGEKKFW